MKSFNTTAVCIPSKHYMVDLTDRLKAIKKLVDAEKYFTINRARQYGKTTTLTALKEYLENDYIVVDLSFESIGNAGFANEAAFVREFCRLLRRKIRVGMPVPDRVKDAIETLFHREDDRVNLGDLSDLIFDWCYEESDRIVLFIDEVDSTTNNQVFLDFLAQLRDAFISRDSKGTPAFHSVILAGVTDVKHLKNKIRPDDAQKVNSPWNIAADFDIDMSLSESGIQGMLDEYETDHHTGMDTEIIAKKIRAYTNGYPFFVSRICQILDTKSVPQYFHTLSEAWTEYGVDDAVRRILSDDNTFFDSVMGKLENMPELKAQLRSILLRGETIAHLPDDEEQKLLRMYGFIVNNHTTIAVANRIFEMRLYQYFIGESRKTMI